MSEFLSGFLTGLVVQWLITCVTVYFVVKERNDAS